MVKRPDINKAGFHRNASPPSPPSPPSLSFKFNMADGPFDCPQVGLSVSRSHLTPWTGQSKTGHRHDTHTLIDWRWRIIEFFAHYCHTKMLGLPIDWLGLDDHWEEERMKCPAKSMGGCDSWDIPNSQLYSLVDSLLHKWADNGWIDSTTMVMTWKWIK